jgi:branched-chain amino acid transport system permease protein
VSTLTAAPLIRHLRPWLFLAAVALVAVLAISYTTSGDATRLSNTQLIGQVAAFLMAALGLNLLVGKTGMHSFAQGAFLAIGAYAFAYTQVEWSAPYLVGLAVAAVVPAVAGAVIAVATTRMRGPQLAMVTLILAVVVQKILSEATFFGQFGGYPSTSKNGSSLMEPPTLFGWILEPPLFGGVVASALVPTIVLAALLMVMTRRLMRTPWGLSLSLIKQSEILATHVGVNVYLRKIAVVSLAAGMAGLGGAAYATVFAHLQPETFSLMLGVNLIVMVILGGSGTVLGPIVGTALIVYLQTSSSVASFVRWENSALSDRWYLSAQGLIAALMLAVLFAMPRGIVGTVDRLWRRLIARRAFPGATAVETTRPVGGAHAGEVPEVGARGGLVVDDVSLSFGGIHAVAGVSFGVAPGTVVALIGPNGAGKSSVVNLVSGIYQTSSGSISLGEQALDGMSPASRARGGVARTFQTPIISPELTVAQNAAAGLARTSRESLLAALFTLPASRRRYRAELAEVDSILALVGLSEVSGHFADELSYGQQRLLEIARALVSEPAVLVLDEPAAGLNPTEIAALDGLLERLRTSGLAILLVEHHMDLVRRVADHVVCMIDGQVATQGTADAVLSDPVVIGAYLGTRHAVVVEGSGHA